MTNADEAAARQSALIMLQLDAAQAYVKQLRVVFTERDKKTTELINEFVDFCVNGNK